MPESPVSSSFVPSPIAEWLAASPLATQLLDAKGEPLLANAAYSEMLTRMGWSGPELLAKLLAAPNDVPLTQQAWLATLAAGECLVRQLGSGTRERHTFHLVKLVLSHGSFICCMLMPVEESSEARLTGILNTIPVFILELDMRGNVSYLNDPLRQRLGYALRELRRPVHLRDLLEDYRSDDLSQRLAEVGKRGRVHFRGRLRGKDGTSIPMEMSLVAGEVPSEGLYLLTARDIGAQLAHEATLAAALSAAEQQAQASEREVRDLRSRLDRQSGNVEIHSESEAFRAVVRRVRDLADVDIPVLITGEPGSGKRFLARTLHQHSRRAARPLVMLNCALLPPEIVGRELFGDRSTPGALRAGAGSTLVLHAVDALSTPVQRSLAQALQAREFVPVEQDGVIAVSVRIVCTTTRDLQALVDAGQFSADLSYEVSAESVATIPLRERREDIHQLVGQFIQKFNRHFGRNISGVDATTLRRLEAYSFPGNVRELESLIERAFSTATEGDLPLVLPPDTLPVLDLFDGTLTEFVSFEEYQRKYIQFVLDSVGGKVSGPGGAAEILQMHPQTLFSKLRKLGIRR